MTARIQSVLLMLAFAYAPYSAAQNAPTLPVSHEEVIQLEVTSADFAAVAIHRRVHTSGVLNPEGGRYGAKTFETDSTGALVEVKRDLSSLSGSGQAPAALASSGGPAFTGYGFYPADVSLASPSGQTVVSAQVHNVYVNCTAACWGYPPIFEARLFNSDFIHVADQYVGSDENGRYSLGPALLIKNYPITSTFVTKRFVNDSDIDAILHAASLKVGSGYNHIYNIFFPKGLDYCTGYAPPYSFCFSPDDPSAWGFCALHGTDAFSDVPGTVLATVQPYLDVFATVDGQPFFPCIVGGTPPFNTDNFPTPNGVLLDSQADDLDHEIFETISDPDGLEWQALFLFPPGEEIGDLCNPSQTFPFFPVFNVSGHPYEIQAIYSNKYHACVTVP